MTLLSFKRLGLFAFICGIAAVLYACGKTPSTTVTGSLSLPSAIATAMKQQ